MQSWEEYSVTRDVSKPLFPFPTKPDREGRIILYNSAMKKIVLFPLAILFVTCSAWAASDCPPDQMWSEIKKACISIKTETGTMVDTTSGPAIANRNIAAFAPGNTAGVMASTESVMANTTAGPGTIGSTTSVMTGNPISGSAISSSPSTSSG